MFLVPVILRELESGRGYLGSGKRKLPEKLTWLAGFLFF
jgi:hypothetical protein